MSSEIVQWVLMIDVVVATAGSGLSDPDYRRRETAVQALQSLGTLALPFVQCALRSADPEVAWRATTVDASIRRAQTEEVHYRQLPWIDMLPPDMPDRQAVIRRYLEQANVPPGSIEPPGWPGHRRATLLLVRDLLRDGASEREVVLLLEQMLENERVWQSEHRQYKQVFH